MVPPAVLAQLENRREILELQEGDVIGISFPGAPTLDGSYKIRRDGRITLRLVGEVEAAGKTPTALQEELSRLYEPHLQVSEVLVSVETSPSTVYVTGAVLQPGKLDFESPVTALEAIMGAGGFDETRANKKRVIVVRREHGNAVGHRLDVKPALKGKSIASFFLRPNDIVYVPERLQLF